MEMSRTDFSNKRIKVSIFKIVAVKIWFLRVKYEYLFIVLKFSY